MIDMHNHHQRCGHAEGDLESVARAAHAKGARIFGWSDHAPLFADPADQPRPRIQMAKSAWRGYLEEAAEVRRRLRHELPCFDVRIGVEADYLPGTESVYAAALAQPAKRRSVGAVRRAVAFGRHPRQGAGGAFRHEPTDRVDA